LTSGKMTTKKRAGGAKIRSRKGGGVEGGEGKPS